MNELLVNLSKILNVYGMRVEEHVDGFYVQYGNEVIKKIELDDHNLDIRFIFYDELYHFRAYKTGTKVGMTSFHGSFLIDEVIPIEEYKIISNKNMSTFTKKIYSPSAVKKYKMQCGSGVYQTEVSYKKEGYIHKDKSLIRLGDDLYSTVGLYEIKYGSKDDKIFNYLARIDNDRLSFWEVEDDEDVLDKPIGEVMNQSEVERCIKSFISSKLYSDLYKEVKKNIPNSLMDNFNEYVNTLDALILDNDEDLIYIKEFLKEFDKNGILKSTLENKTKENVVKLVRCEF